MPGKLDLGLTDKTAQSAKVDVAKAYCEGRQDQLRGLQPENNPHNQQPGSEAFEAWINGFNDVQFGPPASETGCAV